ncbi:MAG: YafY family protein [Anaerolineae bacterium]
MYSPTTRLLTILELLQARGEISGAELAARLEVEPRSVRRYITMLRDMGIPVEAERGRYGAYSLRPGYRLPPLMFNEDEILAVVLGLITIRHATMAQASGIESASAKIERVLPLELRQRVRALQETLTLNIQSRNLPPSAPIMVTLSQAAHEQRSLHIRYQATNGDMTERLIDPYGLAMNDGAWYTAGYCHLRQDIRVFRLDRILDIQQSDHTFKRPPDFNVLDYVQGSIALLPGGWEVRVWLEATLDEARRFISPDMAVLDVVGDGVMMRCTTQDLLWMAQFLLRIPCAFRIEEPPELRRLTREAAERVITMLEDGAN